MSAEQPIKDSDASAVERYLSLMDQQRQTMLTAIQDLPEDRIWRRPEPDEWCIGEILDHTRKLNLSFTPILKAAWLVLLPWAKLRRRRPYATRIADPYARPNFPMQVGWLWTPSRKPESPVPLATLAAELEAQHDRWRAFFGNKSPDLLGNLPLYDPLIGRLNMIQALRVGVYHDDLHYRDVLTYAERFRAELVDKAEASEDDSRADRPA